MQQAPLSLLQGSGNVGQPLCVQVQLPEVPQLSHELTLQILGQHHWHISFCSAMRNDNIVFVALPLGSQVAWGARSVQHPHQCRCQRIFSHLQMEN